jgi:hypothetical protein
MNGASTFFIAKQLISKEKGPHSPFLMATRILAAKKLIASQA